MAKQKVVYAVFRRGRQLKSVFGTYEQARSFARKLIRKSTGNWRGQNPDMSFYEYSVKRVTA